MTIAVLFVAGAPPDAVRRALTSVADAIDAAEAAGFRVESVLIDAGDDHVTRKFLRSVEGGEYVRLPRGTTRSACWRAGLERTSSEFVWLTGADACPSRDALVSLANAARASDVAVPYPDPGPYALVKRAALEHLLEGDDSDAPLGDWLSGAQDELSFAPAADAGTASLAPPRTRGLAGATLDVAHPSAVLSGQRSYSGPGARLKTYSPLERIEIGAYCSIAESVTIIHPGGGPYVGPDGKLVRDRLARGAHQPAFASTFPIGILVPDAPYFDPGRPGELKSPPLTIGHDVWIGYGATISGPVTIGDGAIIGTGAVVLRDVAAYAIVAGNPATVLRSRFGRATVERLQRIRWWDWPPEFVVANWIWFTRPIARFVAHFDPAGALLPAP
jgi:acetyltransferase-like isoleucine patch superfamily enzyme